MTSPIESNITCEQFADALPEFLEREVDETTRARLESHALGCDECGPLLADLRRLRIDAANLPELTPSRDLWSGIAARIETPIVEIVPGAGTVRKNTGTPERSSTPVERRRISPLWIGLAAAGIVAVTATVTHELTTRMITVASPGQMVAQTPEPRSVSVAPAPGATRPIDSASAPAVQRSGGQAVLVANKPTAEETYDSEIKRLRVIVAARRATLDTTTVAVIEKNLKVIDDAIAQCRGALAKDPASRFLLESLNDALDTKVQLLRTAAMLPSRS